MWHFPLLSRAKDAITALAVYASDAVVKASNTLYVGFTDAEANKQRFNLAVSLVMDNPKAVQAAKDILSKVFMGFLMKLTPVASALVGLAVELAYQSFKAASAVVNVPPVINPPAPETIVDTHEQAEPGDTR